MLEGNEKGLARPILYHSPKNTICLRQLPQSTLDLGARQTNSRCSMSRRQSHLVAVLRASSKLGSIQDLLHTVYMNATYSEWLPIFSKTWGGMASEGG